MATPLPHALRIAAIAPAIACLALAAPTGARADNTEATPLLHTSHRFPNGYMEYTATAGDTITDSVTVENAGPGPGAFVVFAADGLTSQVTGVVYADMQHPFPDGPTGNGEYGAGSWISLSATALQLAEGQGASVDLTVRVPASAGPGDWVGSVSAENPVPSRSGGQFGLNVTTRVTIAVVVHVAGPVKTQAVNVGTPFITVENRTRQILNIPLMYFGDVLLKPYLNLQVVDSRHRVLLRIDRQLDTFVPHTTLIFPIPLDGLVLDPGSYLLLIDFGPPGATQQFQRAFSVTQAQAQVPSPAQRRHTTAGPSPLLWLVAIVPVLGVMALPLLWARRRRVCAHCGRQWSGASLPVTQVTEVTSCVRCRTSLLRSGRRVRLCPECFAGHRGWRKTASGPQRTREAVRC